MILLTGAAGFIGSNMLHHLNAQGYTDIVLVDDFRANEKRPNWADKQFKEIVERDLLWLWLERNGPDVQQVLHLGARTDTTERRAIIFDRLNLSFSLRLWEFATEHQIPFVYASSAATYGDGQHGFSDAHDELGKFHPLNAYAASKHAFDKWAVKQQNTPPHWFGLKFFNVYGPNEGHKDRMASVVWHAYRAIERDGHFPLFRSHREDIADGEQQRDFIFVEDICQVIEFFVGNTAAPNGIYNVGTGRARTFNDLLKAVYGALDREPVIEYVDTPEDLRENYQYFTQAKIEKLRSAGYDQAMTPLEEGVRRYVKSFLVPDKIR